MTYAQERPYYSCQNEMTVDLHNSLCVLEMQYVIYSIRGVVIDKCLINFKVNPSAWALLKCFKHAFSDVIKVFVSATSHYMLNSIAIYF